MNEKVFGESRHIEHNYNLTRNNVIYLNPFSDSSWYYTNSQVLWFVCNNNNEFYIFYFTWVHVVLARTPHIIIYSQTIKCEAGLLALYR